MRVVRHCASDLMPKVASTLTGSTFLDDVVAVIGWDATMALVRAFGGRALYVPMTITENHPIARAIGLPASAQLAADFGNVTWTIPISLKRRMRVLELAKRTPPLTRGQIADEVGIGERAVSKMLNESPMRLMPGGRPRDDRQREMFDPR